MNAEFKRMVELAGLAEIKINKPNPINVLRGYRSRIISTPQVRDKVDLTIKCVESVLYLFEDVYPNNDSPRKAIKAAKECMYDPNEDTSYAAYLAYLDNERHYRDEQLDRDDTNKQNAAGIIMVEAGWVANIAHEYASLSSYSTQDELKEIAVQCYQTIDSIIKAVDSYYS
jgi:hypothetical protein